MPRKKTETERFLGRVAAMKPTPNARPWEGDPETEGLAVRMTDTGRRSFYVVGNGPDKNGKIGQRWRKLAPYTDEPNGITLAEARERAPILLAQIKAGQASTSAPIAVPAPGEPTLEHLAEKFLMRQVKGKHRRGHETEYILKRYLLPGGAVIADRVLSILSSMLKWHESQVDDYQSPITRGMRRVRMKDIARDRILSDAEIRALWTATEQGGAYDNLVRFLLLSAQRLKKCSEAKWTDVDSDGIWHIRPDTELASREKGTAGDLPLSAQALRVVYSQPQIRGNDYIFACQGSGHFKGYSFAKKNLDKRLLDALRADDPNAELEPWRVHDLRRTARSLMARIGVQPHIAEMTLGHVQKGIIQVYDRYTYEPEKKQALEALAGLVESIVASGGMLHEAAR
jgi:integrase